MIGQLRPRADESDLAWLPSPIRALAAVLFLASRLSLLLILVSGLLLAENPFPLPALIVTLVTFALVPAVAASLLQRIFAARTEVAAETLRITRRSGYVEVPLSAIAAIEPWRLPLPGSGFVLRTRGGRRLSLRTDDPTRLLDALAHAGCEVARAVRTSAAVAFAHARVTERGRWWQRASVRCVLVVLPVALIAFNAHQHIAYGATLGQYYLEGLAPYLRTFVEYALMAAIYVLLYASAWRGAAEILAFAATRIAPSRAATVRRAAEITCAVAVYAGVPALLALRFLA